MNIATSVGIAWSIVAIASGVCSILYAAILLDAWRQNEWIHAMTLTPLMPFLAIMGLAYRHRRSPWRERVLLGLVVLLGVVFLPLFWFGFLATQHPVTKALIKGAVPIGATAVTVLVGVGLEWHLRREAGSSKASLPPPEFSKY